MNPRRIVLFFLDKAAAPKGYAADVEYFALAPVRDIGLETYDLFFGTVPAVFEMPAASETGQ